MPVLELDDLSLRFGGVTALSDLTMEVHKGELLALIGPNGAGKTSVLNCISGLYRPQSGRSPSRTVTAPSTASPRTASPRWAWPAPFRTSSSSST